MTNSAHVLDVVGRLQTLVDALYRMLPYAQHQLGCAGVPCSCGYTEKLSRLIKLEQAAEHEHGR